MASCQPRMTSASCWRISKPARRPSHGAAAIVQFDSFSYALTAPVLTAPVAYQIVTEIEAQFLTPFLVGRRLEMNAVAALPTVVLWGWLWGVDGALLAAPFLVAFKVICENFDGLATIANFLGKQGEPAEPADTRATR